MNKKINILIAEDHLIVATGVKAILDANEDINIVGIVENGELVLEKLQEISVDIVLMDINMPKMNGIICTKKVKELYPKIKVIILTMYNRKQFIQELLMVGADGCVLKSNSGKELMTAIERVRSGNTYFDHVNEFVDPVKVFSEHQLSEREIEVITFISEGLTSKETAERMFISEHTVKTHRKNIFRKLKVKDINELVRFAMNEGII